VNAKALMTAIDGSPPRGQGKDRSPAGKEARGARMHDAGVRPPQTLPYPDGPADSRGSVVDRRESLRAKLFDIGPGGAVLAAGRERPLVTGEGVRLRFWLAGPSQLDVFGRITWIREPEIAEEGTKYGVEFPQIGQAEQEAIVSYLKETAGVSRKQGLAAEVEEKFKVHQASGRLWIWLNGFLNPAESRQLRLRIEEEVRRLGRAPLLAFLDARRLLACPEESLDEIRDCFASMSERESFLCIVLAFNPVATLQIRRIAQLARIGDSFAYFDDAPQATAYWRKIARGWGVRE